MLTCQRVLLTMFFPVCTAFNGLYMFLGLLVGYIPQRWETWDPRTHKSTTRPGLLEGLLISISTITIVLRNTIYSIL